MKREWRIRRQLLATSNGQQRWDRAYQLLLSWTPPDPLAPSASAQPKPEVEHASSDLCAGVDAAAGTDADD